MKTAIVPAEVREILRSPLPGIGHLKFIVHEEDVDFPIAEIVDGLLWISSHLETLSLEYKSHYCDKFSFQVYYIFFIFENSRLALYCRGAIRWFDLLCSLIRYLALSQTACIWKLLYAIIVFFNCSRNWCNCHCHGNSLLMRFSRKSMPNYWL